MNLTKHLAELLDFQQEWIRQKISLNPDPSRIEHIFIEYDSIKNVAFRNFDALGFRGIVFFIDGKIKGYAFGVPLSDNCMDEYVEKGDRNIPNLLKVLFHEFAKICCSGYEYINKEEDLGIEGLRKSKLLSRPKFLMDKYILTETGV